MDRSDVRRSCNRATLDRLKAKRPDASPWKATTKLGRDNGQGYSFKASTVIALARESYALMQVDPELSSIAGHFDFPEGFPGDAMLGQNVAQLRRWIVADVCGQTGVPDDGGE